FCDDYARENADVRVVCSKSLERRYDVAGESSVRVILSGRVVVLILAGKWDERYVDRGITHPVDRHEIAAGYDVAVASDGGLARALCLKVDADHRAGWIGYRALQSEVRNRNAERHGLGVVSGEAVASSLKSRGVWRAREHRRDKAIEARYVKEERVIGLAR